MVWLSGLGAFVTRSEFGFPYALAVEFDAVGIVCEAIKDSISEGGFSQGNRVKKCVTQG